MGSTRNEDNKFYIINIVSGLSHAEEILYRINETSWGGLQPGFYVENGSIDPDETFKSDIDWPVAADDPKLHTLQEIQGRLGSFGSNVKDMVQDLFLFGAGRDGQLVDDYIHSSGAVMQVHFSFDIGGRRFSINCSFRFSLSSCIFAWVWVQSHNDDGIEGFKSYTNINDAEEFRSMLRFYLEIVNKPSYDMSGLDVSYAKSG